MSNEQAFQRQKEIIQKLMDENKILKQEIEMGAETIAKQMVAQANLYKVIWLLVNAVGGIIRISRASRATFDPRKAMIETNGDPATGDFIYTAGWKEEPKEESIIIPHSKG